MRVLHVVHNFLGDFRGGTPWYVERLAAAQRSRHDVAVATSLLSEHGSAVRVERHDDGDLPIWAIVRPRTPSLAEGRFVHHRVERALERVVERVGPDVAHVHSVMNLSLGVFTALERARVPSVASLHDYWYQSPRQLVRLDGSVCWSGPRGGLACIRHCSPMTALPGSGRPAPRRSRPGPRDALFVYRWMRGRRNLGKSARFIAPSAYVRERFVRFGVSPSRIDVIPWGVPSRPRPERGPTRPPVRFGFLGNVAAVKGADLAIEAFRDIDPARGRLSLHGAIPAEERAAFERRLAAAPHVRWEGTYDPSELDGILVELDVVVAPSRMPEPFNLVVREAFQAGLPVVARRAGALPEAVRDGVDGLLFDHREGLARAVRELVEDPGRVDRLRDGIAPVKGMDEHAREVDAVYGRVVAGPG